MLKSLGFWLARDMHKGCIMRIQEVKPSTSGYVPIVPCYACKRMMQGNRETIWADLDGPAFEAYYCDECKQAVS